MEEGTPKIPTYYCGAGCQKQDWETHKRECKSSNVRKIIYRTGQTCQELFFILREILFDKAITKIEKRGEDLVLYEGNYIGRLFVDPPQDLVDNPKDWKAILSFAACSDAVHFLGTIVKDILEGNCQFTHTCNALLNLAGVVKRVEEMFFETHNHRRNVQLRWVSGQQDPRKNQHTVFLVKLKNSEAYIIDLAGAQFGYYDAVVPYNEYMATIVQERKDTFGIEHSKNWWIAEALQQQVKGLNEGWFVGSTKSTPILDPVSIYAAALYVKITRFIGAFDAGIVEWEKKSPASGSSELSPLKTMFSLPHGNYTELEQGLRTFIKAHMLKAKQKEDENPLLTAATLRFLKKVS